MRPPSPLSPGSSLRGLPIFPLPDAVLFPNTLLPLHVFEPRYLALLEAVMRGNRRMGVVRLAPGWEPEYFGAPAVCEVLGIGEVVLRESAAGGKANILLHGVGRARITHELGTQLPYRTVDVVVMADDLPDPELGDLDRHLTLIRQLFLTMAAGAPRGSLDGLAGMFDASAPRAALLDAIASAVPISADQKQGILEETRVLRRAEVITEVLGAMIGERFPPPLGSEGLPS